ncbi:TfoX/Sxy family protein [Sulfitobacter sp. F26204]|uniref:TfoX/Sxy family protein n=1 Tax=Sulfitobacter sp. F26204 TaxID=2996014 RepID=UPI00225DF404|nr:TfoX/Sxy family protein [Sulfitobacter sp. F26204]MCX7560004.1 TfoX/Sxy family protein [Sulfitobacter sp. F26204]
MSLSDADIAFARDLFSGIPDLTTRKMFGGLGIYADGVIFALMKSEGQMMLKAQDPEFASKLTGMGAEKWTYTRKSGKLSAMPYWTLPDQALDEPELAHALACEALSHLR